MNITFAFTYIYEYFDPMQWNHGFANSRFKFKRLLIYGYTKNFLIKLNRYGSFKKIKKLVYFLEIEGFSPK